MILVLVLTGVLVPKRFVTNLEAERDSWKTAFDTERAAHEKTRDALVLAEGRGVASVEVTRTLTAILGDLGHRTADPDRQATRDAPPPA